MSSGTEEEVIAALQEEQGAMDQMTGTLLSARVTPCLIRNFRLRPASELFNLRIHIDYSELTR